MLLLMYSILLVVINFFSFCPRVLTNCFLMVLATFSEIILKVNLKDELHLETGRARIGVEQFKRSPNTNYLILEFFTHFPT